MKLLFILTAAMLSFGASASDYTYTCKQRTDRSPVDPALGKITVIVKQLKQLQSGVEYRGQYADAVDEVLVTIQAQKRSSTKVLRTTKAIALSEDVMFNIDSNGIVFHLYMDELDEAGISFKHNNKKISVDLACDF